MNLNLDSGNYVTTGKLSAKTQLKISRKLSPAIPLVDGMLNSENADKDKKLIALFMLARIPDEDSEAVVDTCLGLVFRRQESGLAKVQATNGTLMFDDLTLSDLLEITASVIAENLGDFFRITLSNLAKAQG